MHSRFTLCALLLMVAFIARIAIYPSVLRADENPPTGPGEIQQMDDERKVEAVKGIIALLFAAQRSLKALAPEYRWAGLGNLLGDFGEFIAIQHYNLTKAPPASDGFDALTADGKTVQIKANHAASQIGFRGEADLMLVIHVADDGEWEEIYYDDFQRVKNASRYSARDNKHMIAISKLKRLLD